MQVSTPELIVKQANYYAGAGITEIQVNNGWSNPKNPGPSKQYQIDMIGIGWYFGAEWCAANAILCWKKCYVINNPTVWAIAHKLVSLNSQQMADNFHNDPIWPTSATIPQLGAIVVWQAGDSKTMGHAGIVVWIAPDGKSFKSVEGNTSSPSLPSIRNGWTIAIHTHLIGLPHSSLSLNLDRFIYPIEEYKKVA